MAEDPLGPHGGRVFEFSSTSLLYTTTEIFRRCYLDLSEKWLHQRGVVSEFGGVYDSSFWQFERITGDASPLLIRTSPISRHQGNRCSARGEFLFVVAF